MTSNVMHPLAEIVYKIATECGQYHAAPPDAGERIEREVRLWLEEKAKKLKNHCYVIKQDLELKKPHDVPIPEEVDKILCLNEEKKYGHKHVIDGGLNTLYLQGEWCPLCSKKDWHTK